MHRLALLALLALLAALAACAAAQEPEDVVPLPDNECPAGCYRSPGLCPIACRARRACEFQGGNVVGKQRFGFKCEPYADKPCPFRCTPYPACRRRNLGAVGAAFDGKESSCRFGSCAMGNLLADALLARGKLQGASIALVNSGSIRAGLKKGDVSFADLEKVLPFGNRAVVVTVSGVVIVRALENGLRVGNGRFPQVAGMVVKADFSAPQGVRVRGVTVGGEPLLADRLYRLVTSSFVANGGDDYAWPGAMVVEANTCETKNLLKSYIKSQKMAMPDMEPRIINTAVVADETA